ncbi:MAG: DegV family protein [Erysipelotrichales bacterium]|nr:DegV family protein [Erysipelotrichales bacterium]
MIKVFVDTASSIKFEEAQKYDVELIPLRYTMGEKEYEDGIDLTIDEFYKLLLENKYFPKTSLPNLGKLEERINAVTANGDDVIILVLSSKLSGSYNSIKLLFEDNKKVHVIDSLSAVGGMRILVEEINKYRNRPVDEIIKHVENFIPRIKILAIPETLNYLAKGGRLSRKEWLIGSSLHIKPVITFKDGCVKTDAKKIGLKTAMKYIANEMTRLVDTNYTIVPSYTYNDKNLRNLINMVDSSYQKSMCEFDNLDPVLACHWGPNAFGFIFVKKENVD